MSINYTAEPGIDADKIRDSVKFQNWLKTVDLQRFVVKSVHFQSVDMFGPKVGFIKFKADVVDEAGKFLPGIVFMRGGSVGMLVVLVCEGTEYAVLTVQPRIATGSFGFVELPAGMLDDSGNFAGVAAKEIQEELDMVINENELTNLSNRAGHENGFFLSPGGSDETMRLFFHRQTVTAAELASYNGKCTGELSEGEQITLKIVPLDGLWAIPDAKTFGAVALYQRNSG